MYDSMVTLSLVYSGYVVVEAGNYPVEGSGGRLSTSAVRQAGVSPGPDVGFGSLHGRDYA